MNWVREYRATLIVIFVIAGIFGLAASGESTTSTPTRAAAQDYKKIDDTSKMVRGSADAKTSLIQYSDFLCPSCSYFSTQVMPAIDTSYIETNKVRFEFRPMAFIADGSFQAGMGAYCAIDQGKFWPYHDAVYTFVADKIFRGGMDPKKDTILTASIVKSIAANSGVNAGDFDSCLDSRKYYTTIANATKTANNNGINGTPYIMVNGKPLTGNPSLAVIEAMIQSSP